MSLSVRLSRLEKLAGATEPACTTTPRVFAQFFVEIANHGKDLSREEYEALVLDEMQQPWAPYSDSRPLPPDAQRLIDEITRWGVNR